VIKMARGKISLAWGIHCYPSFLFILPDRTFSILNLRTCVAGWNCAVGLILTPI